MLGPLQFDFVLGSVGAAFVIQNLQVSFSVFYFYSLKKELICVPSLLSSCFYAQDRHFGRWYAF